MALTVVQSGVGGTGNTNLTYPSTGGTVMVSGNMPAFSAGQSASGTSVSAGTPTKIIFDSEEFDTANCFSSSRFTPTVAGYYQINGTVNFGAASATIFCAIYKNGSAYKRGQQSGSGTSSGQSSLVSAIVYLNGSTDYVEIYGYSGNSNTTSNDTVNTWFNGSMVRSA
jgi:hypothetical protein